MFSFSIAKMSSAVVFCILLYFFFFCLKLFIQISRFTWYRNTSLSSTSTTVIFCWSSLHFHYIRKKNERKTIQLKLKRRWEEKEININTFRQSKFSYFSYRIIIIFYMYAFAMIHTIMQTKWKIISIFFLTFFDDFVLFSFFSFSFHSDPHFLCCVCVFFLYFLVLL